MFEYLYRVHSRRVYAICLRIVGNTTEAEESDARNLFAFAPQDSHLPRRIGLLYLVASLAVNLVLMRLRRKAPPIVSIEATLDPDNETASPYAASMIGAPDLLLEGSIDRINLERCIQRLPVGYRTIFVLHDIQGYQHNEIAGILGRSVGVSK